MPKSQTQLTNLAIKWRGTVIATCSVLEKEIESFLVDYFTQDTVKGYMLWVSVLDRLHFDGKISVLNFLIKKSFDKETFTRTYGKLFSELRYVKDERNKYAHYIHTVREEPTDLVTLMKWRDEIRLVDISEDEYKNLIKRMNRCIKEIKQMQKKVHKFKPLFENKP